MRQPILPQRNQFERTDTVTTKFKVTVTDAQTNPHLARIYCDVLVAAAREINDAVSQRVVRAHNERACVDVDNEFAFDACIDEIYAAEAAFLCAHRDTEVTL
jgi:hypothetical protein